MCSCVKNIFFRHIKNKTNREGKKMNVNFRTLRADEIDLRAQSITAKGLILLCYQDARAAMNLLDETVGCLNWQNDYVIIDDVLYCKISIYDDAKNQWITKIDAGTESNTEAEKGRASDAFKRAAVRFGIGRELYTSPFIWIPSDKCNIKTGKNGKLVCYDDFVVSEIEYDERRRIIYMQIKNLSTGAVVFEHGTKSVNQKTLSELRDKLSANHISWDWVARMHKVKNLEQLTQKQAAACISNFDKLFERWNAQRTDAKKQIEAIREANGTETAEPNIV